MTLKAQSRRAGKVDPDIVFNDGRQERYREVVRRKGWTMREAEYRQRHITADEWGYINGPPEPDPDCVYFIQAGEGGPIKIGLTEDVTKRVAALQTGNPEKLAVLLTIPGGPKEERRMHRMFSYARITGEWFRPVPKLLRFIEENSDG